MEQTTEILLNRIIARDMHRAKLVIEECDREERLKLRSFSDELTTETMPLSEIAERLSYKTTAWGILSEYSEMTTDW